VAAAGGAGVIRIPSPLGVHTPPAAAPVPVPPPERAMSEEEWARYLGFVDTQGRVDVRGFRAVRFQVPA
jgi:hypothetical protein